MRIFQPRMFYHQLSKVTLGLSFSSLLLLQRSDTDTSLQDLEGYTAFDLYNSTLNGTKPCGDAPHAELYTWGANRYKPMTLLFQIV